MLYSSLSVEKNKEKVFEAGEGAGASGSFFFYSSDDRFLIKTIPEEDMDSLLSILDSYIGHLSQQGQKSLLARIYGLFTVYSSTFVPLHIIIMQSVSKLRDPARELYRFDLKGSTENRYVPSCISFPIEYASAKERPIKKFIKSKAISTRGS